MVELELEPEPALEAVLESAAVEYSAVVEYSAG